MENDQIEEIKKGVVEAMFSAFLQFLESEYESEAAREGYAIDPDYAVDYVARRLPPDLARYTPKAQ